jgi:hypothetical protein
MAHHYYHMVTVATGDNVMSFNTVVIEGHSSD